MNSEKATQDGSWLSNVSRRCPVCRGRGSAQGIQNVGIWMKCSNGHEWGYEDRSESNSESDGGEQ